jgi:hypothetical protein
MAFDSGCPPAIVPAAHILRLSLRMCTYEKNERSRWNTVRFQRIASVGFVTALESVAAKLVREESLAMGAVAIGFRPARSGSGEGSG